MINGRCSGTTYSVSLMFWRCCLPLSWVRIRWGCFNLRIRLVRIYPEYSPTWFHDARSFVVYCIVACCKVVVIMVSYIVFVGIPTLNAHPKKWTVILRAISNVFSHVPPSLLHLSAASLTFLMSSSVGQSMRLPARKEIDQPPRSQWETFAFVRTGCCGGCNNMRYSVCIRHALL